MLLLHFRILSLLEYGVPKVLNIFFPNRQQPVDDFHYHFCKIQKSVSCTSSLSPKNHLHLEIPLLKTGSLSYRNPFPKLHLHAYKIDLSALYNKQTVITAPLPAHFKAGLEAAGLAFKN